MLKSIKVDLAAYTTIEEIKSQYSFKTFSDCLHTMSNFFKSNNISPRDNISNSYSESIFNLKNELLLKLDHLQASEHKNTERIIKMNRAVEESLLKPVSRKVNDIHLSILKDFNTEKNSVFVEKKNPEKEDQKLELKIQDLKTIISEQEKSILEYRELLEKEEAMAKEYFRCMKTLNQNMKVQNSTFGKKIFINLPVEEAEELFYLIP